MSRYGDYISDDLYVAMLDFLKEHTIADFMGIVSDAIEEEPDLKKAADLILEEFRSGKLGRISLEMPDEE